MAALCMPSAELTYLAFQLVVVRGEWTAWSNSDKANLRSLGFYTHELQRMPVVQILHRLLGPLRLGSLQMQIV